MPDDELGATLPDVGDEERSTAQSFDLTAATLKSGPMRAVVP